MTVFGSHDTMDPIGDGKSFSSSSGWMVVGFSQCPYIHDIVEHDSFYCGGCGTMESFHLFLSPIIVTPSRCRSFTDISLDTLGGHWCCGMFRGMIVI